MITSFTVFLCTLYMILMWLNCGVGWDSSDVRKSSLLSLIKKAREEQAEVWSEYFNAMLLILLETVTDEDVRYVNCRFCRHDVAQFSSFAIDRY